MNEVYFVVFLFKTLNPNNTPTVIPYLLGEAENWMNNIISKSSPISGLAKKIRFQFFNKIFKHIDRLEQHIED